MQEGNAYIVPDASLLDSAGQYRAIATSEAKSLAGLLAAHLADKGIPGRIIKTTISKFYTNYIFRPFGGTFPGLATPIKNFDREVACVADFVRNQPYKERTEKWRNILYRI